VLAAIAPTSPAPVERLYSRGLYLWFQHVMTRASNMTAVAVLDWAIGAAAVVVIVWIVARVGARRTTGWGHVLGWLAADAVAAAAFVYLAFLAAWGLNYRREPLRHTLDFDQARVTADALANLGRTAVDEVNRTYAPSHAAPWPSLQAAPGALEPAFDDAQRVLGLSHRAVVGRPKRSLLTWYFRRAAIDGMTDPFFLEVVINPEVLPFERPMVVVHEWAHLAGFADESEASFVAWIGCVRAGDQGRYSAWLSLLLHLTNALPRGDVDVLMRRLDRGPRDDLRAIVARVRRSVPMMRSAARHVYNGYLKANRVVAGVASYDEVVTLVAGTRFGDAFVPKLREPSGK
jgi:hypothetical protein